MPAGGVSEGLSAESSVNQRGIQFRARIDRSWLDNTLNIWVIRDVLYSDRQAEVQTLRMDKYESRDEVGELPAPSISGPYNEIAAMVQQLVDEAWEQGIRPRQITSMTAENQAQARHLEDMRSIVQKKLSIQFGS
jgi:hypothetical protein